MSLSIIILAAGKGTRMKSDLPKVLQPLLGKPMIHYAVAAAEAATGRPPVLVVGHQADRVRGEVGDGPQYVYQEQQLGTAHAVQQAEPVLRGRAGRVLITSGDMPLFSAETLSGLVREQAGSRGPLSLLTVISENPRGFGRILRSADGRVQAIVEEAVASEAELAIRELNVGAYCADADWLWQALRKIDRSPKGEYYLTDLVAVAVKAGEHVRAVPVEDPVEAMGINTPEHLAEAEQLLRGRIGAQIPPGGHT